MTFIEEFCRAIARRHGITYTKLPPEHNGYLVDAAASTSDEIMMFDYTSEDIYLASFFHELGHIFLARKGMKYETKLEQELLAWEFGFNEMINYFPITPHVVRFAMNAVLTYQK